MSHHDIDPRGSMSNLKYTNLSPGISEEDTLAQLALDLSLTPNHAVSELWRRLNPDLWEQTQNPWAVLQTVSGAHLEKITSDPAFRATLNDVASARSTE